MEISVFRVTSSGTETCVLCYGSVPVPCMCACTGVCSCGLCLWMVHGSGPLQTQRWGWKNMRRGTTRRGGPRHPQPRRDWSMHLCGAHAQDSNEGRVARDSSWQWVHKSAIRQRDISKLTNSAVLFCLFVLLRRGRGFEESPRVDQVVWGFKTAACGPLRLWGIGCRGKGRYGSCRTRVVKRPRSLRKG